MGIFKNIFTWWEGATFGTALSTALRGQEIGQDAEGNRYFQAKKQENGFFRRWVIYKGSNDSSRVPPEWHGWLHSTIDLPPAEALPAPRAWEKPGTVNLTGTAMAYKPSGSIEAGGVRAAATGDYNAWSPDAA
jgi:NADH:ubiquinone oxidoreductase subunit